MLCSEDPLVLGSDILSLSRFTRPLEKLGFFFVGSA